MPPIGPLVGTAALKQRIVSCYNDIIKERGFFYGIYSQIQRELLRQNILCYRSFIWRTVQTFNSCGNIFRERRGRQSQISCNENILEIIENCMQQNDEATAKSIKSRLRRRGYNVSVATINRMRTKLGWTLKTTQYCQMIRHGNKPKRLQWATDNLNDSFENVIWSDETSVWLEKHLKRSYRKKGSNIHRKPRPKHPLKVHVWAGISKRGKTQVCIFKGTMDANLYIDILRKTLLPFISEKFQNGHRFMQDNDPKHTSRVAKSFYEANNINWWKTPAGKLEI